MTPQIISDRTRDRILSSVSLSEGMLHIPRFTAMDVICNFAAHYCRSRVSTVLHATHDNCMQLLQRMSGPKLSKSRFFAAIVKSTILQTKN